jgi:peptide/nickel transport system permease protein
MSEPLSTTQLARTTPPKPRLSSRLYRVIGVAGATILAILLFFALFPQLVSPYDPTERVGRPLLKPNDEFRLGTNDIGQDLLSELIWGTRISLFTGLTVSLLSVLIGTGVGLLTGYSSNWLSIILLRLVDLTLVLPFLPLVILLSAYLGASQRNVILVLALVSWATPARLVRSRVLAVSRELYVEAARAIGSHDVGILVRHILPSVRALALVQLVMIAGTSIVAEASLSFLGLGDPSAKSWGTMLYFAQASGVFLSDAWQWWVLPTGAMISLSVLSLAMVAYALERQVEPRLRG